MGTSLVDQAIHMLLEQGLPMLPSRGDQKKPCVSWKEFQDRRPTENEIRSWDRKFRPNRWGFVAGKLSGRIVVDFDGEAGLERMEKWGIKPHLRTGSGGYHLHVVHPGWRVPTMNAKTSKASWPWPGVDIRGDGGFAVLLGRNRNGPYVQLRELVPEPFEALPADLRTFLRGHHTKEQLTAKQSCRPQPIRDGGGRVDRERLIRKALELSQNGRNNAGFWLACQLRDNGYDIGEAESAMRCYLSSVGPKNTRGQRESYSEHEMLATVSQAYSRAVRDPWERRKYSSGEQEHTTNVVPSSRRGLADNPLFADASESIGIYVGQTGDPLAGPRGDPLSRVDYSRLPREVISDRRLNGTDLRVYGVLAAHSWQGSVVTVGKRRIAKLAPCAERLVSPSLTKLEAAGHVQRVPRKKGQRGFYMLTSLVFGQKQRAGVHETIAIPDGRRRLASVRKDPKLTRTARG